MTLTVPLKYCATVMPGQAPPGETVHAADGDLTGIPFIQGNAEFGRESPIPRLIAKAPPKIAPQGSVLLSVRAPVGALNVADRELGIGRGLAAVVAKPGTNPRFLWWALHALGPELSARATGSTYPAVDAHAVATLPFPLPSVHIQTQVAAFLDRESARIHALERELSGLMRSLRVSARQSLNAELDRDAERHGRVKLGWFMTVLAGFAFPSERFAAEPARGVRLLRGVNVAPGRVRWDDTAYWPAEDAHRYKAWELRPGDLVLGLDRPWINEGLRVAQLSSTDVPALLLQRVACLRPRGNALSTDYVRLWLEHDRFEHELSVATTGISVPHISPGQVAAYRVAVPAMSRQIEVTRAAVESRQRAAETVDGITQFSRHLAEYRDALIAEAVTGQIDIARISERQADESALAAMEGEQHGVLTA